MGVARLIVLNTQNKRSRQVELERLKWVSRGWLQRVKGLKTLLLNNVLHYSMRAVVLTVTIIFHLTFASRCPSLTLFSSRTLIKTDLSHVYRRVVGDRVYIYTHRACAAPPSDVDQPWLFIQRRHFRSHLKASCA